jgi:hypothetical protein
VIRLSIGLFTALLLLTASCGDSDDGADCNELREPEDPASVQHVIGSIDFEYQTDPPTSGPHVGGAAPTGTFDAPLDLPIQVRILEQGGALLQYDPAVFAAAELAGFADVATVVTPGDDLPAPLVVTAWTWKLSCQTIDSTAIEAFVGERPLAAPGAD